MVAWLKGLWARTGLWVKLAGIAVVAALGYIGYLQLKRRGAEKEAEDLRRENAIKEAEVRVAYLEGQKVRNAARLAQIPAEAARIDGQILAAKRQAEEARARIAGMTDEQVAERFRELGY